MSKVVPLVVVLLLVTAGCDGVARKVERQLVPVPVLVSWQPIYQPFSDNQARVHIRNVGDEGFVKVTVSDASQQWTSRHHFNAGEERVFTIVLKGCTRFSGKTGTCEAVAD